MKKQKHMKYYNFCLLKAYFDKGMSITSYVKYLIALFGISSLNVTATLIIGFVYGIACFFIGLLWFKLNIINAEIEVQNRVNPFVKEMRKEVLNNGKETRY